MEISPPPGSVSSSVTKPPSTSPKSSSSPMNINPPPGSVSSSIKPVPAASPKSSPRNINPPESSSSSSIRSGGGGAGGPEITFFQRLVTVKSGQEPPHPVAVPQRFPIGPPEITVLPTCTQPSFELGGAGFLNTSLAKFTAVSASVLLANSVQV